jgi:hypothetical protein
LFLIWPDIRRAIQIKAVSARKVIKPTGESFYILYLLGSLFLYSKAACKAIIHVSVDTARRFSNFGSSGGVKSLELWTLDHLAPKMKFEFS